MKKRKKNAADLAARQRQLEGELWSIICEAVASKQDANAWLVIRVPAKLREELTRVWEKLDRARQQN
jgi:hypothetical protein